MPDSLLVQSFLRFAAVALGFVIVFLAWRAYRRGAGRRVLWLSVGMGLVTVGVISEGIAFQGLGWPLDDSHLVEGGVTLAGFGVLVYSLYA